MIIISRELCKFSDTPAEMKSPPPGLGEHNDESYKELGMTEEERANLAKENVI